MWHVTYLFQKWFGAIKQLLPLGEGDMTICSPSTGYIAVEGEQIVMSPSLKGRNCMSHVAIFLSQSYLAATTGK